MITLHPYISEVDAYHLVPLEYRWIFNKLELCERLGNGPCGPVGTWMPPGEFCVRPIINIGGSAGGGFRKHTVTGRRGILHKPHGYCWTPWTDAFRAWRLYLNDEPIYVEETVRIVNDVEYMVPEGEATALPDALRGISRYLLVETLGDIIIDVGPRHLADQMCDDIIADYRTLVPDYQPPSEGTYGFRPNLRRVFDEILQGYRLEEMPEMQIPWSEI